MIDRDLLPSCPLSARGPDPMARTRTKKPRPPAVAERETLAQREWLHGQGVPADDLDPEAVRAKYRERKLYRPSNGSEGEQ
jgi:hypothetical protein